MRVLSTIEIKYENEKYHAEIILTSKNFIHLTLKDLKNLANRTYRGSGGIGHHAYRLVPEVYGLVLPLKDLYQNPNSMYYTSIKKEDGILDKVVYLWHDSATKELKIRIFEIGDVTRESQTDIKWFVTLKNEVLLNKLEFGLYSRLDKYHNKWDLVYPPNCSVLNQEEIWEQ